jgi:hypothetical protein
MTLYLATNYIAAFDSSTSVDYSLNIVIDPNSGFADQLRIRNNNGMLLKNLETPLQEGWIRHWQCGATSANYSTGSLLFFFDTSGNTIFALRSNNADLHVRRYSSPSAFTEGANIAYGNGIYSHFDWNFKIADTGGFVRLYINNVLAYEFLGDTSLYGGAPIGSIRFNNYFALGDISFGNFIIADEDTRGMLITNIDPMGVGDLSEQAGSFTDVNTRTRNDATGLTAGSAGLTTTFALKDSPAGNPVYKGVFINARAVRDATGPQNTNLLLRTGGANYHGPDVDPGTSPKLISRGWGLNPATGVSWTNADIVSLQSGVRSRT